eukprot:1485150-Pleurochrysis_carterae.AAC.1
MAAEMEELNAENQLLRDEITELAKGFTEPGKEYFHRDGFTLAVELAIAEAITTAHVSRNQVLALFLTFARFFRIKLPSHRRWQDDARRGKTHVKEVCATLNQAHKLQIGTQLLEADDGYCATSPAAPSRVLRPAALPPRCRRQLEGDNARLEHAPEQELTSKAQVEAFKESLRETAALLSDVGITEAMEPRILNFAPASTMNDRAASAREAARLVRGDDEAKDDPTCAHHAITNIFEEGRKAMDAV